MKKSLLFLALFAIASSASAMTFYANGLIYGNVCRNGMFYYVYPVHMSQPVGAGCAVRDNFGNFLGYGSITAE